MTTSGGREAQSTSFGTGTGKGFVAYTWRLYHLRMTYKAKKIDIIVDPCNEICAV